MKKLIFFLVVIMLLASFLISYSQTCDCDRLQEQVDDLNSQMNILKGYGNHLLTKEKIEEYDFYKVGDYYFRDVSINIAEAKDNYGRKFDELAFQLMFRNSSETTVSFNESMGIRFFQQGIELEKTGEAYTEMHLRSGAGRGMMFYVKLFAQKGVIEIELFPLDDPDNVYSRVIYKMEE